MPRDAVSRTAHVGTVGTNGLSPFRNKSRHEAHKMLQREDWNNYYGYPSLNVAAFCVPFRYHSTVMFEGFQGCP